MNTQKVSNFFSLFSTSQKFMIAFVVCVVSALVFADEGGKNDAPDKTQKKLVMEESEWKKKLSPEQYRILRQAGTERPFGDVYKKFKDPIELSYFESARENFQPRNLGNE